MKFPSKNFFLVDLGRLNMYLEDYRKMAYIHFQALSRLTKLRRWQRRPKRIIIIDFVTRAICLSCTLLHEYMNEWDGKKFVTKYLLYVFGGFVFGFSFSSSGQSTNYMNMMMQRNYFHSADSSLLLPLSSEKNLYSNFRIN